MAGSTKLLALETATLEVGAAVFEEDRLLAASSTRPGRLHAETLHPAIEQVLSDAGTTPSELGAVAVDIGPGLFTGLRVGIAAAKAFGLARSIPVVGVRSTEALREMARRVFGEGVHVVPVVDMRRGELAWESEHGSLEIGTPETLASRLADAGPVVIVGDGAQRIGLGALENVSVVDDETLLAPSVESVARIGMGRLREGSVEDAVSIEPVYLRQADATANFETRPSTTPGVRR
jgi:tRNA threonylcarbamoyladenosine biosynthesis protein TsaB